MNFSGPAFEPTGLTVAVAGAETAPDGVQVTHGPGDSTPKDGVYMFHNPTTKTVYAAVGASAAGAKAAAVIPTTGQASYPIGPAQTVFIRLTPSQFVSAITKSGDGSNTIFVTPGRFR